MKTLEIILQGEAIGDVQLVVLPEGAGHAEVLIAAAELRGPGHEGEFLVFVQEEDAPLKPHRPLPKPPRGGPLCLHVHRCKAIEIEASFNGRTKEVSFAPSRTVGSVKTIIATKLFGMTPHDAAEHVLQITGTTDRPDADIHIGSLAKRCRVAFDLVPLVRVEG